MTDANFHETDNSITFWNRSGDFDVSVDKDGDFRFDIDSGGPERAVFFISKADIQNFKDWIDSKC